MYYILIEYLYILINSLKIKHFNIILRLTQNAFLKIFDELYIKPDLFLK